MGGVFRDIADNWHVYAAMPVIAALIGYITKRAAIEMMYRPLEFVGVRPFLGWQGVIPRNAHRMASVAMELMTTNLIEPKEIFARLDPKRITEELREPLARAVDQITHEIMTQFQKRKQEVARDYGQLIAKEILTVPKVMEALLTGPKSDRLYSMIQREIQRTIDAQTSLAKPFVVAAVGSRRYQEMKQSAARRAVELLPETARHVETYATEALDVRNTSPKAV